MWDSFSLKTRKAVRFFFTHYVDVFCMYACISLINLYRVTQFHIHTPATLSVLGGNIFLIIGVYVFNKATDKKEDHLNNRPSAHYSDVQIYVVSGLCFLSSFLLYLVPSRHEIVLYWFLFLFLGVWYSFPKKFRLKNFFLVKNIIPAVCWLLSVSILIFSATKSLSITEIILLLIPLFFLVFVFEILWDMPDWEGDRAAGVCTLPVYIGFFYTKITLEILLLGLFIVSNTITSKIASVVLFIFVLWVTKYTQKHTYHVFLFFFSIVITCLYFLLEGR